MPRWVEQCITRYLKKGLSKDEASKRCYGAYNKRKKKRTQTLKED